MFEGSLYQLLIDPKIRIMEASNQKLHEKKSEICPKHWCPRKMLLRRKCFSLVCEVINVIELDSNAKSFYIFSVSKDIGS